MPSLREWRHIIAAGAEQLLSTPATGHVFRVVPFASGKLPDRPCGLVQSGGNGVWTDATADAEQVTTAGQFSATFSLWLVVGDPLSERSHDVLDDLAGRLHRAGGLPGCATDPGNPDGFVPVLEGIDAPGRGEFAGADVWWAPARLVVPVSLKDL